MKFGLTPEQIDYITETVVRPLEDQGAKVWCYGSRARGNHKKFSDLDLMIEANDDLSQLVYAIREKLENGNFPYKVDLVELKDFAQSYRQIYDAEKKPFGP